MRRAMALMMGLLLALLGCVWEVGLAEPERLLPASGETTAIRVAFAAAKPAALCAAPSHNQLIRPAALPALEDAPGLLLQRRPGSVRQGGEARWAGAHVMAFKHPGLAPPQV